MTRFICARKSRRRDHRGRSAAQKTGLRLGINRVSASIAIMDRAYGKAPTFSTTDTTQLKRAIDMTDDELAAIVAKARLSLVK
jgi:hypothetical protein